jgi:hypothetical protein
MSTSYVERLISLYKEGKVEESTMYKMAAFKAELQELIEKEGMDKLAMGSIGKGMLIGALIAPTFAASNYLIGKGLDRLEKDNSGLSADALFSKMLEYRPELKNEDQLLVKKYWDSLVHFAPSIASDPLAAGAYIRQAIQYEEVGGPPYSTVESLVKTQKTFKEANPLTYSSVGEAIAGNTSKYIF